MKTPVPRIIALIIVVVLLAGMFTACADKVSENPSEDPGSAESESSSPTDPQDEEPVTAAELYADYKLPSIVSIGSTTTGSSNNTIGVSIASVLTGHTTMDAKSIATSGSSEYVPMMEQGEIEMGIIANYDGLQAYLGKEPFETLSNGEGYDLRILVCGSAQYVVTVAAGDAGINTGADLAGCRYCYEYTGNASATAIARALLANHNLYEDDVTAISIESIPNAINAIIEGRLDAAQASFAVANLYELESARGVSFIGLEDDPEALERIKEFYPGYVKALDSSYSPWITDTINALAFDNYLIGTTEMDDALAYYVTKCLYENNAELCASSTATTDWVTDTFVSKNVSIPYHDGAVAYYKEIGVWTDEMQELQDSLLAMK